MNPSWGFPAQGRIWAAQDTQNLAWPSPASTPALALLPVVKGTLWGQKATHCVTGDKGAGDRGAGQRGATTTLHPTSSPCRGVGSLEFPLCTLQATPGQVAGGAAPVSSGPGLTVKHVIRRRSDFGGSEPPQNGGCKFSKSHTRHRCLELLE